MTWEEIRIGDYEMDCKKEDDNLLDLIGALDFIDNLAQLGIDCRMSGKLCEEKYADVEMVRVINYD